MDRYNGIAPMIKETGMTSHDVINRLRRISGQKKIGHTGTLDPLASGLLLICFGRATKLTQFLTDWDKTYRAEITLGSVSDTLDKGGLISESGSVPDLSNVDLEKVMDQFRGKVMQKVPAYSAVKVGGQELYKYARKGIEVETPSREIEITSLKIISYVSPILKIDASCSKGTYIRTLADDIGQAIGCGAYLSGLVRTSLGPYELESAATLTAFADLQEADKLNGLIRPIENVLSFPTINVRRPAAETIINGGNLRTCDIVSRSGDFDMNDLISIADESGRIKAIGKATCTSSELAPENNDSFFSYVRVLS
ncbi:MAG: tRNA pseudouridine(55) synthase TruB [FCB group bacterium]|nr:tRNA pseudouridine(55) synthase TruB [FCB group bacterium]